MYSHAGTWTINEADRLRVREEKREGEQKGWALCCSCFINCLPHMRHIREHHLNTHFSAATERIQ